MAQADYFDIRKLFPVLKAKRWEEGQKFMEFWAGGGSQKALPDPRSNGKPTVGWNSDKGLRIYTAGIGVFGIHSNFDYLKFLRQQ